MKKIVLIADGEQTQFDSIEELKESIIPNYLTMSKDELKNYMYEKVFGFSMMNNLQIVDTSRGVYEGNYKIGNQVIDFKKAIIIDNMDSYILSLCKFNIIILLEDKNNRYYTKGIDVNRDSQDYIAVNEFANSLLKKLVGEI